MKNISHLTNKDLQERVQSLVRRERRVTRVVLECIIEIEKRQIHAELGYKSLYAYLTQGLGYSETAAYRRVQASRLLRRLPTIAPKIDKGSLNLSQLTHLQKNLPDANSPLDSDGKVRKILTDEEAEHLLNKVENLDMFNTKAIIARELNIPVLKPILVTPQQDDSVRLELTFSKEQYAELIAAKEFLSHTIPDGDIIEVIAFLARRFNQKKLGPQVKKSVLEKSYFEGKESSPQGLNLEAATESLIEAKSESAKLDNSPPSPDFLITTPASNPSKNSNRVYISHDVRRLVMERAKRSCQYQNPSTGKRCGSRHQLEVDHLNPVAWGGTNDEANLQVLCRMHNQYRAKIMGLSKGKDETA